MELLMTMTGAEMTHVPYKGSAPSVIGLIAGEVSTIFLSIPAALPQIRSGRIKAIAVSTLQRSSALPEVPTLNESGLRGYTAASWYGLFAPAGTPKDILDTLSREIVKIMRVPDIRDRFANDGFEPAGYAPAEFSKFLREELVKWARVVTSAGIKPQSE
jgi:tripartite-type tricarboxylate transporter receptor subunit TctC